MKNETILNQQDLCIILNQEYNGVLGKYRDHQLFKEGGVQTNILLQTSRQNYALRLYETRSTENAIFETELLQLLKTKYSFPCPAPIKLSEDQNYVKQYQGKPLVIFEFIEGVHPQNPKDCKSIQDLNTTIKIVAQHIAWLHTLTINLDSLPFTNQREGRDPQECKTSTKFTIDEFRKQQQTTSHHSSELKLKERMETIEKELTTIQLSSENLPYGIIHGDCGHTNFLFSQDQSQDKTLLGVIDFDDSCYSCLIYDLSNLIYFWAWPPKSELNFHLVKQLINEYQTVRVLNQFERHHLFDALKMVIFMSISWFIDNDSDYFDEIKRIEYLNSLGREKFKLHINFNN